jgi:hypothetical protein
LKNGDSAFPSPTNPDELSAGRRSYRLTQKPFHVHDFPTVMLRCMAFSADIDLTFSFSNRLDLGVPRSPKSPEGFSVFPHLAFLTHISQSQ